MVDRYIHRDTPDVDPEYGRAIGVAHADAPREGVVCFLCHVAIYADQGKEPGGFLLTYDTQPGANRLRCGVCERPIWEVAEKWYQKHDRAPADLL